MQLRILLTILVFVGFSLASTRRRMTHEEKVALRHAANEADRGIRFIDFEDLEAGIHKQGLWIVFFGAHWCHQTQRLTPKYLNVQRRVQKAKLINYGFQMAKVECSLDHEVYCHTVHKIDGYPTLLVYVNGTMIHEYPDSDEEEPLYNYILRFIKDYSPLAKSSASAATTDASAQSAPPIPALPVAAPEEDVTKVQKDKGHEGDIDEEEDDLLTHAEHVDRITPPLPQSNTGDLGPPVIMEKMAGDTPISLSDVNTARTSEMGTWDRDIGVTAVLFLFAGIALYIGLAAVRIYTTQKTKYQRVM
ncbi:hypothetical protein BASA61_002711 [Batrachochytrium salamandrivorans]|nr:hypothetical protein BASA60_004344 [Batrachochytrium salamandrivorans]KAH6599032.1 hypothetical protein BASA61_002711 [Batrachochytrium salamandrivorans]KAH9248736.1 hypothetical protein BASA81_013577 [Batrachochytrium salamandrivorans]KAH9266799.1 hypothetical protein BASA83_010308 [Batrachochytrium salamandrivorans]